MAIDRVFNAPWIRKHDLPDSPLNAPEITYPKSLREVIDICSNRDPGIRVRAAGSHWALSRAAISDNVFVETHDPRNNFPAMGRTLYEVVPGCLNRQFINFMAAQRPPAFGSPNAHMFVDDTFYLIHVETGKRIYQLYAELDQGDLSETASLASLLNELQSNDSYSGPWTFGTLGGAGGQTVFGALTTGTHGGDFRLPPIADSVAALHLVADGGMHYWIEPASHPEEAQLTDDDLLMDLYGDKFYGGPEMFRIIRDDDWFNAVLVSAGRFGIVYSVVLRVVRQYSLHEERRLTSWQDVRGLVADPHSSLYSGTPQEPNRFLQIAVCLTPHDNFQRNLAGVTRRWNAAPHPNAADPNGRSERVGPLIIDFDPQIQAPRFQFAGSSHAYSPDPDDPDKAADPSFLERACTNGDFLLGVIESACEEIRKLIEDNAVVAGGGIAAIAAAGGGAGLLALAAPLALILALLLAFLAARRASGEDQRLGQVMEDVKNELLSRSDPAEQAAGLFAWQLIAYKAFASQQEDLDYDAISYAVMDRHDYLDQSCNVNVDSIEVFFDATDPMLVAFVDALLAYEISQEFVGRAFVGYVSLRFTAKSRALLGMERYPLTCAVEVAGLKDVTGVTDLIDFAISLSRNRNFGGILHWGQRNESDVADIEFRFGDPNDPRGGDLGRWREVLSRVTDKGRLDGFSSQFTRQTGLEVV